MTTHICVDVDLLGCLASESDELSRIKSPDDHFAGFLDSSERLGRARVVPILNCLDLPKHLLRYSGRLKERKDDVENIIL